MKQRWLLAGTAVLILAGVWPAGRAQAPPQASPAVDDSLSEVRQRLERIESRLDGIEAALASRRSFAASLSANSQTMRVDRLESRLARLEAGMGPLTQRGGASSAVLTKGSRGCAIFLNMQQIH